MKNISREANLSKEYTNHCIRATSVTVLDDSGFEARHIMSLSGHRSESSIRSYSRTSMGIKRKMSTQLSNFCEDDISFSFGIEISSQESQQLPLSISSSTKAQRPSAERLSSFIGNSAQNVEFNNCIFNFN